MRSARRLRGLVLACVASSQVACEPPPTPQPAPSASVAAAIVPTGAPERLLGEWIVTSPRTLATAAFFEPRIAAAQSPEERTRLEQIRDLNIRRVATIVKVNRSHLAFHTIKPADAAPGYFSAISYDVRSGTRHEATIELHSYGAEPAVLTFAGSDEIYAPGLTDFTGGTIWRRAGTRGAGLP